ncbi:DUF362 domain-containing protein [Selenomonas sp.]|uniref:DUF362 domain-containing protein n=1 Tax=Selenomonas sp. TaxID=2053611 RepID=UPI0025DD6D68|nr:DUF362 domain-containing protein [Selenomonas sp.]
MVQINGWMVFPTVDITDAEGTAMLPVPNGKIVKKMIHAGDSGSQWGVNNEEFMERMTELTQVVVSHFKDKIACINVMRNMSVDCDCAGTSAQPVVTPDIGIVASLDILAVFVLVAGVWGSFMNRGVMKADEIFA